MGRLAKIAAVAVLLTVCAASSIPMPQAPLTNFVEHRMATLVRTQAKVSIFKGSVKGMFNSFGHKGTYTGDFSGSSSGKTARGRFTVRATGRCDTMGMSGSFTANSYGTFRSVSAGKDSSASYKGRADAEYKGRFDGKEAFVKVAADFKVSGSARGFIANESGKFNMRVGGKNIDGTYGAKFDGETIGVKMVGTVDGKKLSIKYEIMFEDFMKYIENKGEYTVMVDGKTFTGKFDAKQMMLPN